MARCQLANEVTFVTHTGQLEIRLTDRTINSVCDAATKLGARYFVMVDDCWFDQPYPVWGVFDMRTADRNNPVPGVWSVRDPIKRFPWEAKDAAVMYALAMLGRRS